jgi:hypothetical protein
VHAALEGLKMHKLAGLLALALFVPICASCQDTYIHEAPYTLEDARGLLSAYKTFIAEPNEANAKKISYILPGHHQVLLKVPSEQWDAFDDCLWNTLPELKKQFRKGNQSAYEVAFYLLTIALDIHTGPELEMTLANNINGHAGVFLAVASEQASFRFVGKGILFSAEEGDDASEAYCKDLKMRQEELKRYKGKEYAELQSYYIGVLQQAQKEECKPSNQQ